MAPILFGTSASVPFRAVLMCAKQLGLNLDVRNVDLMAGEHKTPEFLRKNPMGTVPLLEDNGFYLSDSHAINGYLASKYGKENDPLYPAKDLERKSLIDHRLHFDSSLLAGSGILITKPLILENTKPDAKALERLNNAFRILNSIFEIEKSTFVVGNSLSIADFNIISSLSSWKYFLPCWEKDFPYLKAYLDKMAKEEFYKENLEGLSAFNHLVEIKLK
ncbi:hypothetical protein ABEB36_000997 [Hypothenemus hampei]|uniref:Glutathione transferase n=1 Tax=Hypothenemus hampei TaxID=57062 RepID=A0ABD1FDQ8_HYPHA